MGTDNGKPLVTVVGLLPAQANRVEDQFGDRIDLRFLDVDTSIRKICATSESSDHVVLMTKFMPHDVQAALRKHDGLTYCNGGVTSCNLKLEELLRA